MYNFPIGVILESFRVPRSESIKLAASLGATGIQMYARKRNEELSLEEMTASDKAELLKEVKGAGLVFSAVCGDLGIGFGYKEKNPEIIDRLKKIMYSAKELETNIVTTHIGVVPTDKNHERYKIMQEACSKLAAYADSIGSHFAIETGPETSAVLKEFLDSLGSRGVAVNLDPANLAMVVDDDAVTAVHNLKDYIVHTHAKDGVMLRKTNPEYIYKITPMPEDLKDGSKFYAEVPLGTGSVNFNKYLRALDEVGYRGFLTIEREVGENPAADIKIAYDFLNGIIANNK
jgi:sugar phosphate isomerase/epimerase